MYIYIIYSYIYIEHCISKDPPPSCQLLRDVLVPSAVFGGSPGPIFLGIFHGWLSYHQESGINTGSAKKMNASMLKDVETCFSTYHPKNLTFKWSSTFCSHMILTILINYITCNHITWYKILLDYINISKLSIKSSEIPISDLNFPSFVSHPATSWLPGPSLQRDTFLPSTWLTWPCRQVWSSWSGRKQETTTAELQMSR